jgi:CRISPR-associated protein Csb1
MTQTPLDLATLSAAVAGGAVAIRARTRLQPAGGPGDKVFPPTYADAKSKYAIETRRRDGGEVAAVVLDSVASQANRLEEALLRAWEELELPFPVIGVDFASAHPELADLGTITTLNAPHRIADAILRDSVDATGTRFRDSEAGRAFAAAKPTNAAAIYHLCPTALIFGVWDSTGADGGMGTKFQRSLVSEVVGYGAVAGVKTASRLDPLAVERGVAIYHLAEAPSDWTADEASAEMVKAKPRLFSGSGGEKAGRPSNINHGNVAPTIDRDAGGVTLDFAEQVSVLSLAGLRKLRFPTNASGAPVADRNRSTAENAARTALAALALLALVANREQGYDLRSRCVLVPDPPSPLTFELVSGDGTVTAGFHLLKAGAADLLRAASGAAAAVGFPWERHPISLVPAPKLVDLVLRSRALGVAGSSSEDE